MCDLGLSVLRRLGYRGSAIVQFKRDARTGAMKMLEVNGRYSTWTELPSRSGCNFPVAAYASITGQRLPHLHQQDGRAWLDFHRDRRAFATYRRGGEWSWRGYLHTLSQARCWAFFAP